VPSLFASARRVFATPGFAAFLFARCAGMFATQIQAVVVAWQLYDETRDPMALAFAGLAQFLPMLLFLMPAGDLMDRRPRKPLLAASWVVAALCAALLWLFGNVSARGGMGVTGIYAVLFCFGASRAFSGPAVQSLLPQIVPREKLAQAIATNGMLMRAASIVGPLAGGFLYAAGGARLAYAVCVVGFVLGALCLAQVRTPYAAAPTVAEGRMAQRFGAGIRFIFQRPVILGSISLDLFAVLLGGVVALLPIYASEILHCGAEGLGLLRSAIALGEVGMGFFLAAHPFDRAVGKRLFIAVALFGCANLVFALSTFFWLSFVALMLAGAADMVSVYVRGALVQFATPDAMRGRVSAVNMLFIGSSNELGEFRAGTLAAWLGTVSAAALGGLCTLAIVAFWTRIFRPLYQVDRFEETDS
jgi:MFS family permease